MCEAAEQVGAMLARMGITVLSGGRCGVMEAVSKGACEAGGLTVGIMPSSELDEANPWCHVVVPTGIGYARNAINALAGDVVISIGGASGTLSEICYASVFNRPVLLLTGTGGWTDRLAADPPEEPSVIVCESMDHLKKLVIEHLEAAGFNLEESED
jgi:uncharacterized protein (TIGR00725 family)